MRPDPHTHCPWPPRVSYVCVPLTQINWFFSFLLFYLFVYLLLYFITFVFQVEITQTHHVSLTVDLMTKTAADYRVRSTHSRDIAGQRDVCRTTPNYSEHCPILNLCLVLGFSFEYFQTQLNLRNWRHRKGKNKTTYGQGRLLYCPKWLK